MTTDRLADDLREEREEWRESVDGLIATHGPDTAARILADVAAHARRRGLGATGHTPYRNTIPTDHLPPYPGDLALESRIDAYLRWNAMAMVVRANKRHAGLGGHLSTYASTLTLWEVGFRHFFRGRGNADGPVVPGDQVFFQGHASPGIYARAFLEGRLTEEQLEHFRRETGGKGLSSYCHVYLMPQFWQFPNASMGLGPVNAIYHARFMRYLQNRGIIPPSDRRVWAFIGDGEMDEPESLGGLSIAAREELDNLVFVINCNLQRLDGPVRGNGSIVQELEGLFNGYGWNVIKLLWGSDWDPIFARDA